MSVCVAKPLASSAICHSAAANSNKCIACCQLLGIGLVAKLNGKRLQPSQSPWRASYKEWIGPHDRDDWHIRTCFVICSQTSLVNLKVEWGGRAESLLRSRLRRCVLLPLRKRFDSRQSNTIWRAFQKLGVDTHLLFYGITSSYVTQKYTERFLCDSDDSEILGIQLIGYKGNRKCFVKKQNEIRSQSFYVLYLKYSPR